MARPSYPTHNHSSHILLPLITSFSYPLPHILITLITLLPLITSPLIPSSHSYPHPTHTFLPLIPSCSYPSSSSPHPLLPYTPPNNPPSSLFIFISLSSHQIHNLYFSATCLAINLPLCLILLSRVSLGPGNTCLQQGDR